MHVGSVRALERARPASVGVDPGGVRAFVQAAHRGGFELHSLMLYCRGAVVAEAWWWPYGPGRPHMLHSATKTFLSAAVGLAVSEGAFGIDDPVVGFFPGEWVEAAGPHISSMTVRHLLTMTPGHEPGISMAQWRDIPTSLVEEFLRTPVRRAPGSHFAYSSAPSYVLSAIIQATTGEPTLEYLQRRLLVPLGIADLRWDRDHHGIHPGGRGAWATTEGLLRLGLLHLRGGLWEDRQLLPRWWVNQATAAQVPTAGAAIMGGPHPDSEQGYGFHLWRGRHGTYRAFGLFGQYSIVIPDRDAVLALTGGLTFTQQHEVLDLVWEHLLPAIEGPPGDPGRDTTTAGSVERTLFEAVPAGAVPSGRIGRRAYAAEPGGLAVQRIELDLSDRRCVLGIVDHRGRHEVICGIDDWHESVTSVSGFGLHHAYELDAARVVARAWWRDPDTLIMTWCFVETAFTDTVTVRFLSGGIVLDRCSNVNSGPTVLPGVHAVEVAS